MLAWKLGGTAAVIGALMGLNAPIAAAAHKASEVPAHVASPTKAASAHSASAKTENHPAAISERASHRGIVRSVVFRPDSGTHFRFKHAIGKSDKTVYGGGYGGISCVPFARANSGIELKGNAANWWDAASGVYARGETPETGSVMNFRATGHMRLGHVAVVAAVLNSRMVEIDHANWAGPGASRGGVSRGIPVIDVSEANDWSAVRVGLGHSGTFGSVYPTYGFIYDRPDNGRFTTARRAIGDDEVAEAPAAHASAIDAAPRSLR